MTIKERCQMEQEALQTAYMKVHEAREGVEAIYFNSYKLETLHELKEDLIRKENELLEELEACREISKRFN